MLPDRTSGSALFADISGFTTLTESLRETLGARPGAEALSMQMGEVFSALVAEVEKYEGSVIDFAGDSMLCWFENQSIVKDSSLRAVTCGFGMQTALGGFPGRFSGRRDVSHAGAFHFADAGGLSGWGAGGLARGG
jgi:class 3 adenylate cyclase